MIRPFNLRKARVDSGEVALLNESFVKDAGLKIFRHGTVMFARVGEIGAGVSLYEKSTISPNIIAAELLDTLNPYFLSIFANTKFGRIQLEAGIKAVAQPTISTDSIRALRVPRVSSAFQLKIAETFNNAALTQNESISLLTAAEKMLIQSLGLEKWQTPEPLSYIRHSSEAFAAGRLDAEYFHPSKATALILLREISDVTVGDLFTSVRELWKPDDGPLNNCVRNYDLSDALSPFLDGGKSPVERSEIASTKKILRKGDLVVSRLRSYLREIAIVEPSYDYPMVASTEYIVLRQRTGTEMPVEALLIYLRSLLPQLVFKWSQDGSNHPRFDEKELLRLPVPRALINDSIPYVTAMQKMKSAKQRATQLLDAAKRAVEIAIEDSEEAALQYLAAFTKGDAAA